MYSTPLPSTPASYSLHSTFRDCCHTANGLCPAPRTGSKPGSRTRSTPALTFPTATRNLRRQVRAPSSTEPTQTEQRARRMLTQPVARSRLRLRTLPLRALRPLPRPAETSTTKKLCSELWTRYALLVREPRPSRELDRSLSTPQFFATRLSLRPEPASPPTEPKVVSTPGYEPPLALPVQSASKPAPPPRSRKPPQAQRKPPSVARATRPGLAASQTRSYPPIESHSSAALSLLHWLLDPPDLTPHVSPGSTSTPFFLPPPASPSPVPPPLVHRDDVRSSFSWRRRSDGQTTYLAAFLFGDASIAWIRLEWHASSERSGAVGRDVRREGRYRPRPQVEREWDGARLYAASERYGPRIVRFAEEALSGGRPIARGECWDLANEALKACEEEEEEGRRTGGQVPFPSLARTHGALIYYADARGAGTGAPVVGEWTGGDLYVRPGDIVEWRSVTIREVGMRPGSYSTLGDPEVRWRSGLTDSELTQGERVRSAAHRTHPLCRDTPRTSLHRRLTPLQRPRLPARLPALSHRRRAIRRARSVPGDVRPRGDERRRSVDLPAVRVARPVRRRGAQRAVAGREGN